MSPTSPRRTCVGCRDCDEVAALVRIAVRDGVALVDRERRVPGRGVWLHPRQSCLAIALKKRAIPRGLRAHEADVAALASSPDFA